MSREIGKNIRRLRMEKGMTQEELAQQLHVTRQAVSLWETGKSLPDVEMLQSVGELFGQDLQSLLGSVPTAGEKRRRVLKIAGLAGVMALGLAVLLALAVIWRSNGGVLSAHYNVTTTDGRIAYLQALGWEADPATETAQEIVIPRVFSGVFSDYNALQKQQGFDLSTYAGETCTAYTYRVTNYEGSTDTVLAQLFVYRNRVIGGDIHATAMDGFMHGLR